MKGDTCQAIEHFI